MASDVLLWILGVIGSLVFGIFWGKKLTQGAKRWTPPAIGPSPTETHKTLERVKTQQQAVVDLEVDRDVKKIARETKEATEETPTSSDLEAFIERSKKRD